MTRLRKILIGVGALAAALLITAGAAAAVEDQSVTGTTDHTIYKAGRTVTITGTVNGDIICAAQTVSIDATVNGDVICAGQTVTVNGTVNGNVRVAAQTVNIGAKILNNANMVAQDANLQSGAVVGRDSGLVAQTASLDGPINRDINAVAGNLTLNNSVGRDVYARVNKLALINHASIGRNLNYTSPTTLFRDSGVTIGGTTNYHKAEPRQRHHFALWWHVWFLVAKIVVGVVLVGLFPQLFKRWHAVGNDNFALSLLVGFLAMFVVPIAIIVAFASLVGIPIAILLILLAIAGLFPAATLAMYFTGSKLVPRLHPVLIALVGAVVLGLLEMVPWLGALVLLVAFWYGSGALLLNLKRAYKRPKYS